MALIEGIILYLKYKKRKSQEKHIDYLKEFAVAFPGDAVPTVGKLKSDVRLAVR